MARNYIRVAHGRFSFASQGGAISTISLSDGNGRNVLPAGAIILGGTIDVITALTSGGSATIALGTTAGSSATALLGATAIASWTAGQLALTPIFTAATYVKMTAQGSLIATVATATLAAGVFEVHLNYIVSGLS